MSCVSCERSLLLPKCIDSFIVGSISGFNEPVFIYIKNHATGRLIRIDGISSGAGVITADITDLPVMQNQAYEAWVTEQDSSKIDEHLTMTHEGEEYTCLSLRFTNVYNSNNTSSTKYPYI